MHFVSFFVAFSALLCSSVATPDSIELSVVPNNYHIRVTQWQAGCVGTKCTFKCYVQAPPNKDGQIKLPGFKARCSGQATGLFDSCQVIDSTDQVEVAVSLVPQRQPSQGHGVVSKKMGVSFTFTDSNGIARNYTGYHQAEYNRGLPGGRNFNVQPSEVEASG